MSRIFIAVALAGALLLTIGGLSTMFTAAVISHDMTPKGVFGQHYAYGTTGDMEHMTIHEWTMISVLMASGFTTTLGLVTLSSGVVGALIAPKWKTSP